MARIRTIKPEFPQSESMGRVSREARLLFILLWTLCDDAGRSRGDARLLKGVLYPYDEVKFSQIEGWLAELEGEGCIVQYTREGSRYLAIRNWLAHQKIDRPSKSKFPEPPETVEKAREVSRDTSGGSSEDLRIGGPRTKDQGRDQGPPGPQKAQPPPSDFDEQFARIKAAYPRRTGSHRWPDAAKAIRARLKEGHGWDELHAGVARYTAFLDLIGRAGTGFVQQAATFFGTGKGFTEEWAPPVRIASKAQSDFLAAMKGGATDPEGRNAVP